MTTKNVFKIKMGDRELGILIFLWKWKLVSHAALTCERFFPNAGPITSYNRLRQLRQEGLIEMRVDAKSQNFAWTLTKKGFEAIREFLPTLRDVGFKSEFFEHDLLVTMFHLGDWLIERPAHVKLFTEQELRRLAFHEYPSWVPKTDLHRPDGYFGFVNGDKAVTVAIEVECNRKKTVSYELVGEFYANLPNLLRVVWLVPNAHSAGRIQKTFSNTVHAGSGIHNYVLISEFQKFGWQSMILLGPEKGAAVGSVLGFSPQEKPEKSPRIFSGQLLLNTKKSFVRSQASRDLSWASKRN